MRNSEKLVCLILAIASLALFPMATFAAPATGSKPGKAAVANAASLREIDYASLVDKIGSQLIIRTTNDTTRSGELIRYTNVTLTLQLGPEAGSIELSVPRDSIRNILIEIAPADPLFLNEEPKHEGESGAKKN